MDNVDRINKIDKLCQSFKNKIILQNCLNLINVLSKLS